MKTVKNSIPAVLLVAVPGLLSAGAGYCQGLPEHILIRNTVMLCVGTMSLVFAWFHCLEEDSLLYDNRFHLMRFATCFIGAAAVGGLLPLFPREAWPLIPLAVLLSLFSNGFLGIFSYGTIVMFAVLQTESSVMVFFLYFLCGSVAISLFRHPEKGCGVGIPMTVTLLYLFTAEMAAVILPGEEAFSWEMLVLPGINLFVTALLLLFVLCGFGFAIRRQKQTDTGGENEEAGPEESRNVRSGAEVTDPEAVLMAEMEQRQQCRERQEQEDLKEQEDQKRQGEPAFSERHSSTEQNRRVTVRELTVMDDRENAGRCTMSFYIENETETEFPFPIEEVVETVTSEVLTSENCPFETHVNVLLTDNEGIRRYNREYREIDKPTDVLSFPNVDFESPSDFQAAEKNRVSCFDPDSGALMMGDIVISVDKVKEQADAYGHSEKREFAFLVAHSMLHLCGYDHMEPEEAGVMKKKQITALRNIGITRDYR